MNREKLPEYIFGFMPVLHRKLLRRRPQSDMPRQVMNVLNTIEFHDSRPMKYYCEKMSISKPNMTKIVNTLIEKGFVTRQNSQEDRRVITLHMTELGKVKVKAYYDDLKAQIIESTNVLNDHEMQALLDSFETIKTIFEKLDDWEKECDGKCRNY